MAGIDSLSAGQVAGIIAAGIFVVNILLRLLWPLILVAMMNMNESATTWSKVAANIQGSLWATILQSDSASSNGVRMSIRFTTSLGVISTLLVSLASIITPLGLYESIAADNTPQNTQFAYASDISVFGVGTLPRPVEGFSRICGSFGPPVACPNSNSTIVSSADEEGFIISDDDVIDVTIPADYMAYLQSGAQAISQTVSSIFDIGYRTYTYRTDTSLKTYNDGKKYAIGSFNQFDTLFLDEGYLLVEGLIVDTKNGGIGFRNHSIPAASTYGATWTEDILFIEPQTQCVNTNLTFEWTIPLNGSSSGSVVDLALTDNGGFVDMNDTFPEYDTLTAQDDPQLAYRAYRSAWLQNAYTALYYNVTNPGPSISGLKSFSYINSELGQQIPMIKNNFSGQTSTWLHKRFSVGEFGSFFGGLPLGGFGNDTLSNQTTDFDLNVPDNPWQISKDNFTEARDDCNAVFPGSRGNLSNILSFCGSALGIPQQKGGPNIVRFEPGTSYTQPLYGCASIMRAVIKTVSFKFNGTGLAGLTVENIEEKRYNSESEWPTWGVETADFRLINGNPLWGIVAPDQKDRFRNMTFTQKPDLFLPGYIDGALGLGLSPVVTGSNLAGANFYADALAFAYSTGSGGSDSAFDYSGASNLGAYNKWANMSGTPEGAAKIIDLIWTDAAANSVIGTKGWLPGSSGTLVKRQNGGSSGEQQVLVPVNQYTRRVRYHLAYAIPAFIVLAIFGSAFAFGFIMTVLGQAGPGRMRLFLMKTSVGRVMTSLLLRDEVGAGQPSKVWASRAGRTHIDFIGNIPRAATLGQHPGANHSEIYDPILESKSSASIRLRDIKA